MKDLEIKSVSAAQILDSRGNPTVRAEVTLASGTVGAASVPSGASTGRHEAFEKRDGGKRYRGKGVESAIASVNNIISPALVGVSAEDQQRVDGIMITLDGTADKSKLGANAILAVSLAAARAAARHIGLPLYRYIGGCSANLLPLPMMNILNGGAHADNNVDIQEFMIVPTRMESFSSALRAGAEIYASLKDILHSRGLSVGVGDEGGFAPSLTSEREALDLIIEAISAAGYRAGEDVSLALDIASSEWYDGERGLYRLKKSGEELDSAALCEKICSLVDEYPIISVEDGMAEDDFSGWAMLTERLRDKNVMLVGDDLFVTNRDRLIMGSNKRIANAILVKPNQIGTLSEVCDTAAAATYLGYTTVMSHRSGDTSDSFIADLSVALGSPFIKSGALGRGERVAKYNRLLLIENEMFSPALAADFLK